MAKAKKKGSRAGAGHSITQGEMLETVHHIWLAGVGALANAKKDGPQVFEKLLAAGARIHESSRKAADEAVRSALEQVQTTVSERMKGAQSQATEAFDSLEKIFQTRVHRVLHQLGVPSSDEIAALSKRVDALNESVGRMSGARRSPAKSRKNTATQSRSPRKTASRRKRAA